MVLLANGMLAFATDVDESVKQEEIDSIFREITQMVAAEKQKRRFPDNKDKTEQLNDYLQEDQNRRSSLDTQLERLGVHKIDPNNERDLAELQKVMGNDWETRIRNAQTTNTRSNPPTLSILANCYSLYQYQGNYTVDGVSYEYSYICVIDDKGYSESPLSVGKLSISEAVPHSMVGRSSIILGDLISYTFQFVVSQFLGRFSTGWMADWTLGALFTGLSAYDPSANVTTFGGLGIYTLGVMTVSNMTYYYINKNGWTLCGARISEGSFSRTDTISANIQGRAVSESSSTNSIIFQTGSTWYTYIQHYARTNTPRFDEPGHFTAKGISAEFDFEPALVDNPFGLI